jgi:hypothetical protein
MSASPPSFGGVKRIFTSTLARYRDTDSSVIYFENFAIAVYYENRNPNATKLRLNLIVKDVEKGYRFISTPFNTSKSEVVVWDIENEIGDDEYPSFKSTNKPNWVPVSTSYESFGVTVNQYEGYLILFRNITSEIDYLWLKVDADEYRIPIGPNSSEKGEYQLCFINKSTTPRSYSFQWKCENGNVTKAIAFLSGINNYVEVDASIASVEVNDANQEVSGISVVAEKINLISIQFV